MWFADRVCCRICLPNNVDYFYDILVLSLRCETMERSIRSLRAENRRPVHVLFGAGENSGRESDVERFALSNGIRRLTARVMIHPALTLVVTRAVEEMRFLGGRRLGVQLW
jgi:hypothetical protein